MKKPFILILAIIVVGIIGAVALSKKEDFYALKKICEEE